MATALFVIKIISRLVCTPTRTLSLLLEPVGKRCRGYFCVRDRTSCARFFILCAKIH